MNIIKTIPVKKVLLSRKINFIIQSLTNYIAIAEILCIG